MQTRHFSAVRFRPVSFLGLFCALGLAWLALPTREVRAQQEPPAKTSLPVLTRAEQIRNLTPDQAGLGYPVRLRAVITYCDLSHGDLFVEDATGSIYVDPSELKAVLHSGQYVEVEGTSDAGDFSSEVTKPRITILGEAPIPRPQKITAEELVSGNHDTRWVEVEGVARSVIDDEGRLRLNLASGAARFDAYVLDHPSAPPALVGAKIRLRGVSSGVYTVSNEYIGAALMVPSLTDLHILGHGPADLFSLPVRPIHFLLRSHPEGAFNRPVRLQGVVTLQRLGQVLYVHDGKNAVQVNTRQMTPLGIGDLIDVVGFPALGEYTPILEEAIFRRIGAGRVPPPVTTTASQLLLGAQNGELVRISGRLIGHAIQSGQVSLELVEGEFTFKAGIEDPKGRVALASLRDGSYVQLTGICSVEADYTRRPHSFSILLRSPEDIVVLRSPSWWTLKRMLWAVGVMAGLILAALAWAVLLRRRVDEQTATIREQLRREAALKERYHELFENANDVVFTCGLRGHLTSLNKAGQRITGYSLPEAVGKNLTQMVAPEYSALAQQIIQRDRAQEGPTIHELEIVTKDGRRVLLEVSIRFICDEGLPVAIQGIARDITERKQAEEALRETNEYLQNLFNYAHAPIIVWDPQFRITRFNHAFESLTGRRAQDVIGRSVDILFPPDLVESSMNLIGKTVEGKRWESVEISILHLDGSVRTVLWNSATIYAPDEKTPLATIAQGHDITERKRVEQELHESEERYRSLVEAAPDVIYTVSAEDGSLTSLNPAFETLTGWSRTEWLGKPLVGMVHPDDLPVAVETLQKASRGETPPPYELRVLSKSGEYLVGEFTSTPHVKDGKVVGELGIARDITARKRTEEALRESEERFRSLVENATVGIYRTTPDGRILMANPALVRMLGYESFQSLATRDLEQEGFEPTYPRSAFRERIEREGEVTGLEAAWKRRDGSTIYVRESAHAVRASDGRVLYYDGIVEDVTERKRAEEQLRYQAALLASVNDAIVASDVQYRLTAWNKAAESVYGWKAEEVLGRNGLEILRTEWFGVDADRMRRTIAEKGRWRGEVTQTRKDGTRIPVELSSIVLRDERGRITGYVTVNRDITERKQAEEALRQSKESFEALAENASDAILIGTGEEGRHVYANRRAVEITGYPIEDLLKTRMRDLAHPDELRKLAERYKKRLEGSKVPKPYETALLNKDGIEVPIEISPSKTIWQNQLADMVIFRDITERKRAEEALRESQEMFQKAFQASPDTMVLHSLSEGRHIDVNESFLRLVGYRREELVGRTAMDLGLWWDLAQGNEYLRVLREQGRVRDLEICVRTKSGEARTLLLSAEVIEIAGQDCVVAIGKDIGERKQAEQERTHLEEQLRQAQKMEAVGRLAGGVAHDFNNILMVINGYVQLVLRKLSPRHPLRQNLNEIRKAGERAASLTRQLLAFSRRQILVPRILDLNKVVADTKEMLRRVIGEDLELVIRQGYKLAKVLADPGQIAQVLVNLAVNARDAMPGGGRLTIETGNVDLREAETGDLPGASPGPYVMLAVSDTGVGMSKEVMEHMFEPFFTTRERGRGTGLGLSTVYGIVKQSGGYVRAQSEPGQGSAFRIYLPCAQVGSGKPAARSAKARLAKGRETVLVVEDELAVRQVVAATLRSCGYKVLEAGSGEEAMRRLCRHEGPLHLVLCDLVMPRMNGRKVADSVRTLYPEVKVVFMSGYTDDALLRHGVSDTQGSFLQKPFTIEALTRKVREVLGE